MPKPSSSQVSWAALTVAVAALALALTGGAIGLPGKKTVDRNDLKRNVIKSKHVADEQIGLADLSAEAEDALTEPPSPPAPPSPSAYAFVTGPGQVDEGRSFGVADENVSVNNGAFCIRGIGFAPKHAQVTAQVADAVPKVFLNETSACQGGTAINFDSDLTYPEKFFIALYE
jgi:hypothetical protein